MEGLWLCYDKVYLISLKGFVISLPLPSLAFNWQSVVPPIYSVGDD